MTKLSGLKVTKREVNLIPVGRHTVAANEIKVINSFMKNLRGDLKENLPAWKNPIDQVAIVCICKDGVLTGRAQLSGVYEWDDLSAKQKESGKYEKAGKYAITTPKEAGLSKEYCEENGISAEDKVRIPHPEKTAQCIDILSDIAIAMGADKDDDIEKVFENAVANQVKFDIIVKDEEYEGKMNRRIVSFKKATATVEEPEAVNEEEDFE